VVRNTRYRHGHGIDGPAIRGDDGCGACDRVPRRLLLETAIGLPRVGRRRG
jgi:hypothetical protein